MSDFVEGGGIKETPQTKNPPFASCKQRLKITPGSFLGTATSISMKANISPKDFKLAGGKISARVGIHQQ